MPESIVPDLPKLLGQLTIIGRTYDKEDEPPKINFYDRTVAGYIGVPVDWGVKKFEFDFIDRTSLGQDFLHRKLPDPHHPNAHSKQAWFIEETIKLLQDDYTVCAKAFTGFGKTVSGLSIAAQLGRQTLVIVPNNVIAKQWRESAVEFLGLKSCEIGSIQGKQSDFDKPLVIATVQTLHRRKFPKKLTNKFGLIIYDECHKYGSEKFSQVVGMFSATYKLALSATPKREDGTKKIIEFYFGKPKIVVSDDEALELKIKLLNYKGSKQIGSKVPITIMKKHLAQDPVRNNLIVNKLSNLVKKDRVVLAVTEFISHAKHIQKLLINKGVPAKDIALFIGPCSEEEKEYAKHKAKIIIATYGMVTEGVDIPRLDTGIDLLPRSSPEKFIQLLGRIRRRYKYKKLAIWYSIIDYHCRLTIRFAHNRLRKARKSSSITILN